MQTGIDLHQTAQEYDDAAGLLLDSFVPHQPGGTGQAFDWNRVPKTLGKPVILAGGLTCDNVAMAMRVAQPYAVDVSGGVEAAKGIKDPLKIAAFIERVRGVN